MSSVFRIDAMALFTSPPSPAQLNWRWPHFTLEELACKYRKHCKGVHFQDPRFLDALEAMRREMGPLMIRSGHCCRGHNAAVNAGFTGLSYGRSFLHEDCGPARA